NKSLVPMDDLLTALQDAGCKHTFLILDCCFAGKFRYAVKKSRDTAQLELRPLYAERFERYKRKNAWQVLVSAGPDQTAADWMGDRADETSPVAGDEKPHSPFALALFEALAGKAEVKPAGRGLGDGVLTASELKLYLYDQVEKKTQADPDFKAQYPDLFPMQGHLGGEFIFFDPNNPLNFPERETRNPYKGLKAYEPEDADVFFGRKASVEAAFEYLKNGAVAMVISAPSGLGKSSFARAGLYPKLKNELGFETLLQMRPGEFPMSTLDELRRRYHPDKKQVLLIDQYEENYTVCTDEEELHSFESALLSIFNQAVKGKSLVKILITVRSDFEWRVQDSRFGKKLLELQGDYYTLFRLAPMDLDQLREALVNPALMEAYEFESPQLADRILQEVSYAPGALPLLSLAMKWLFQGVEKIRAETDADVRVFTAGHYEQLGGISGCLSKMAGAVYGQFDETHRDMMRKILLRMVQLQDGGLIRRRVYLDRFTNSITKTPTHELDFPDDDQDAVCKAVLNTLEGNIPGEKLEGINLLLRGTDEYGREYIEPAHDSLINFWPRCLQWIDEFGKENLNLQRQLWQAVQDYGYQPASTEVRRKYPKTAGGALQRGASALWDNNPKLHQLQRNLLDPKDRWMHSTKSDELGFLPFEQQPTDAQAREMERVLTHCGDFVTSAWRIARVEFNKAWPDDTPLIGKVRQLIDNWLNQAELDFFRESWHKRLDDIELLRKERDEARATALIALARRLEDDSLAMNLVMAAHRLYPNEESREALSDFAGKFKYAKIFDWHSTDVSSVAFSPDEQFVLTGSWDKSALLWDLNQGKWIQFFQHADGISSVAFSPDGKLILTGSHDKTARLWDLQGNTVSTFEGHTAAVFGAVFAPDGKTILTGSGDKTARLWDLKGNILKTFEGHGDQVNSVAFSPDGMTILTGSEDKTACLWDLQGNVVKTFEGHSSAVLAVDFSPDGKIILTGSRDKTARLWPIQDVTFIPLTGHTESVLAARFSPDGQMILTGSWDETARLWDLHGALIQSTLVNGGIVHAVAFSPDGQKFLTADRMGKVKMWHNFYKEWETGTIWNRLRKLSGEERQKYRITWDY
ncbi:MAG TPA: WD40 repeat domain-containing protein, partial [Flavilitoribacter sp.]|nr:WD40 repeat domain-containing protein [Flavilitoribacter sp.]